MATPGASRQTKPLISTNEMAFSSSLNARQQTDRLRGDVGGGYEEMFRTEGGTGRGAIRTIPKTYTQAAEDGSEESGYLPSDLEQRQGVREREAQMRQSMEAFSGVQREGLVARGEETEEGEESPENPRMAGANLGLPEIPTGGLDREQFARMAALEAERRAQAAAMEDANQDAGLQELNQAAAQAESANAAKIASDQKNMRAWIFGELVAGVVDGYDAIVSMFVANAWMINSHTFRHKALPPTELKDDIKILSLDGLFLLGMSFMIALPIILYLLLLAPLILGSACIANVTSCLSSIGNLFH